MRILLFLISILTTTLVSAASRDIFCKCTCQLSRTSSSTSLKTSNSTIIPLNTKSSKSEDADETERQHTRTCADCNRQFCLFQDPPEVQGCKAENGGREEDVFTMCFQRDSVKDQAVIYTFIILTLGLLGWAGIRPYVEKKANSGIQSGQDPNEGYAPVPPGQTSGIT